MSYCFKLTILAEIAKNALFLLKILKKIAKVAQYQTPAITRPVPI